MHLCAFICIFSRIRFVFALKGLSKIIILYKSDKMQRTKGIHGGQSEELAEGDAEF